MAKNMTGSDFADLRNWLVVVPARLASTRLPQKAILDLGGKPMVVRVYENLAPLAQAGAAIVVAVDEERVAAACRQFGVPYLMTSRDHATGTDRCAEVARLYRDPGQSASSRSYILNVQGDEPFIDPKDLISLCTAFVAQQVQERALASPHSPVKPLATRMGSLCFLSQDAERFAAPSCVKVVCSKDGHALYFSRSPIPHNRDLHGKLAGSFLVHMGVYAFDREALESFCALPPSPLEVTERLEQLRALEAGWRILMHEASGESLGIDTPADLEAARVRFS